jgi:ribosome-binding protein aMBF1 (putative translation factor)
VSPEEINRRFGERVRLVRQFRGISTKQIATAIGIQTWDVSVRERGQCRCTLPEAVLWCAALGVSLDAMLADAELDLLRIEDPS